MTTTTFTDFSTVILASWLNDVNSLTYARTLNIAGTAGEITSSAGAQDLTSNRTWTLSLPSTLTFTAKTINFGSFVSSVLFSPSIDKITNLSTNGFVKTSGGDGTLSVDTGSYQVLDATLTALAAYNANGILTQTAADTFTGRTITGTANRIALTNGDGVAGNPTVDISGTYVGQSSITTLGTITTGVWNGTIIPLANGGTNKNMTASNGGIVWTDIDSMEVLAGTATANKILLSGATATPSWSTSTIPTSAGATANKVLLSDGTNYVLSTPTFPNASATALKHIRSDGTNWIASTATISDTPSTALKWLRSDGTNWITSTATLAEGAVTALKHLRSDGTNWIATTSTYTDTIAQGDILYGSAASTVSVLAKDANATRYLSNQGASNSPSWNQVTLTNGVTGVLPVANGGTNASSASITAFNNITGYTASGATGTTSTNLVFSTSPTLTGAVTVAGTAGAASSLVLSEQTTNGVNTSTIIPVASLTGNRTVTLPDDDVDLTPSIVRMERITTNQSIPDATYTIVQFNQASVAIGGTANTTTTYRFTPSVAGYYLCHANATIVGVQAGTDAALTIQKNGGQVGFCEFQFAQAGNQAVFCDTIMFMNGSTDYADVQIYQDNPGNTAKDIAAGTQYTAFSMIRVPGRTTA